MTHLGYIEYFSLQGFLAQVIPALPHGRGLEYCCLAAVLLGLVVAEWAGRGWPARGTLFALYLAAALLVTPFAEKHHLALLFPALALTAFARHHDALSRTLGIGAVSCLLLSKPWPSGPFYFFAICAAAAAAWRCAVLAARAAPPK